MDNMCISYSIHLFNASIFDGVSSMLSELTAYVVRIVSLTLSVAVSVPLSGRILNIRSIGAGGGGRALIYRLK